MAETGLFIGWGAPYPGREMASLKVFEEAVAYWGTLESTGEIEGVEYAILGAHGGDLAGFALLHGDLEKLERLSQTPDFQRMVQRAGVVASNVGVVRAVLGIGALGMMAAYKEIVADLV
jgi:hypothetical protein